MNAKLFGLVALLCGGIVAAGPLRAESEAQTFVNKLAQQCYRQATSSQGISHALWQSCTELFPQLKAMKDRQDAEDRARARSVPLPRPRPVA